MRSTVAVIVAFLLAGFALALVAGEKKEGGKPKASIKEVMKERTRTAS